MVHHNDEISAVVCDLYYPLYRVHNNVYTPHAFEMSQTEMLRDYVTADHVCEVSEEACLQLKKCWMKKFRETSVEYTGTAAAITVSN